MKTDAQTRTYKRSESAVFSKTKEAFGGLSNMAAGFPLRVNGVRILTSEALYQACRFPHRPEVQRLIIGEASPMTAKMKSKPYRQDSRPDWDRVRVKIMRWCLRVKLAQNWNEFSRLLLATHDRPIVEESRKDDFWGAKVVDDETLVGMNVLGRLLMELRKEVKQGDREQLSRVEPLDIPDFQLYGEPITAIEVRPAKTEAAARPYKVSDSGAGVYSAQVGEKQAEPRSVQSSLFDNVQQVETRVTGDGLVGTLKPYPEYKESGEAWIGTIPKEWNLLPNRAIFAEVKDKNHPDEEMLSVTINGGIIRQKTLLEGTSKKDSSNRNRSAYKLVCSQDIAYNKMRAWQGAIGVSDYRGIVSPAYVVMRLRERNNARYFHYLFRTPHFAKEAERWSYGITSDMWSLRPEHFKLIYTPLPSENEQAAIVCFLDHVNRRIERAVRAKRKVIALLNEQKQAIIHRAVTRGLDPNVRLKPSGYSWLGDIPQHWDVRRLRHTIRGRLTYGANVAAAFDNPGWPRYLRITDFRADGSLKNETFRSLPPEVAKDYLVEVGDLLLARSGATVGKAFLVENIIGQACHAGYLIRARPNRKLILPEFLFSFTQSAAYFRWIGATFNIATIQNIGADKYADLRIPLPQISEQQYILEAIEKEVEPIRTTINRTEREMALLREYRTRMIADVVTGKLDVRDATRDLPVEIEGAETEPELVEIEEEEEGTEELARAEGGDE